MDYLVVVADLEVTVTLQETYSIVELLRPADYLANGDGVSPARRIRTFKHSVLLAHLLSYEKLTRLQVVLGAFLRMQNLCDSCTRDVLQNNKVQSVFN